MIYINDVCVTESIDPFEREKHVKQYLHKEKLTITDENESPLSAQEVGRLLLDASGTHHLKAVKNSLVLREFKEELRQYIQKVECYIEDIRESEDFSTVTGGFIQVAETLLELDAAASYLQKELIDHQLLNELSEKAMKQTEQNNYEYVLDLIEYELLPILQEFLNETNEEV